ncbi:hypothetical protein SDRG_05468 [Saprolegnia diclina VS20]|uniref:Uncharacterized protein n=1 Tax=Saprolegnia diclina (strain VS20) TaxID=1156394 RepID=T0RXA2_SAPDV|nr:hypothetical protein SDRG_05468 [Saprolegnia diclina VS20]EQC37243.1 hypothetical protein SDRG_05468 [Saprolegnia diclina VS20]|eukprot:XP_008609405.1 hypothetical protein SDRG_05468 [Saprolegnia diclina VS20]
MREPFCSPSITTKVEASSLTSPQTTTGCHRTDPETMLVPGHHARELVVLGTERLCTGCKKQLAARSTSLRAEHAVTIAAATTTLQQAHEKALTANTATLRLEHYIKEQALTTELMTLRAKHEASLQHARVLHTRSEGLRRDLYTLAKFNDRLQTTIAALTAEAATIQTGANAARATAYYQLVMVEVAASRSKRIRKVTAKITDETIRRLQADGREDAQNPDDDDTGQQKNGRHLALNQLQTT